MAVLDFIPQTDQEFKVLAPRRLLVPKVSSEALGKIPVLWLAIDSDVSHTDSCRLPAEPGSPPPALEDRMEDCSPSNDDEDDELRRAKSRAGSVIGIHRCNGG